MPRLACKADVRSPITYWTSVRATYPGQHVVHSAWAAKRPSTFQAQSSSSGSACYLARNSAEEREIRDAISFVMEIHSHHRPLQAFLR